MEEGDGVELGSEKHLLAPSRVLRLFSCCSQWLHVFIGDPKKNRWQSTSVASIQSQKRSEEREEQVKPRRLCFPSNITIQAPAYVQQEKKYFWNGMISIA